MFRTTIIFPAALLFLLLCWFTCSNCRAIRRDTAGKPVSHERWDALLKKYVRADGFVDYKGFQQDSAELKRYTDLLSTTHPNEKNWSRNEQMAYWINAYNAFTIQLVCRHYPVESIKDIQRGIPFVNTVWDIKFIELEGFRYDLNNIEHNILRPVFKDARIHFAVNCASYSCPPLRAEAYMADRLDAQLDDAARKFLADPLRNRITAERAEVSEIFKWFRGDFDRDAGSLRAYLNRYAPVQLTDNTDIDHINYDWRLNDVTR
jgi:Protein of unknown function, DUF547